MILSISKPFITFLVLPNGMIITITCDITHSLLSKFKIKKKKENSKIK